MNVLNKIAEEYKLSLGLVFPIESYSGSVPKMQHQEKYAQIAEEIGIKALWFRDVPFHDPTFGDAGQMYDPWVYMTHIMNNTKKIMLGTASIILPLRHPVHTLKSIHSLQELSNGRIIIGVASGDRPIEYFAFNTDRNLKSELFRDSFSYLKALTKEFPIYNSEFFGSVNGSIDLLPKTKISTSFLVTGHSGQSLDWIAKNADGWLYYPRDITVLKHSMDQWQQALKDSNSTWKPYMQSLYIDLVESKNEMPAPIHLGFRSGTNFLKSYLIDLKRIGVNHVILNLKFSSLPIEKTLSLLEKEVL